MILVMLVTLALIVITGMATAVGEGAIIPFVLGLPRWLLKASEEIHEIAAIVMMVLAGLHTVGVLGDWLLTGDNLIKAMFTGGKMVEEPLGPAPSVGAWRAVALAALLAVAGNWMISRTSFENAKGHKHEKHENHDDDEREHKKKRHNDDD